VFIGSGEASLLERKTLIHSLRTHSRRELDLYVFNGTHNAIEHNQEEPVLAPLTLKLKYRNFTEFSNYRFLIPEICGYSGSAIWLDSDMVCLQDIGELFDAPMDGCHFLAKAEAYRGAGSWGLSVMLIDCAQCRFDLQTYYREIDQGLYTSSDMHQMTPAFLKHHPFRIGELDPRWNEFDHYDHQTKLIHYTNLNSQPWKFPGHPFGELWFKYFRDAICAGAVTERDIEVSKMRAYVRQDIQKGNGVTWRTIRTRVKSLVRRLPFGARRAAA
jgi:lipopolysaccharide biosynthesis glycosyltransferase